MPDVSDGLDGAGRSHASGPIHFPVSRLLLRLVSFVESIRSLWIVAGAREGMDTA